MERRGTFPRVQTWTRLGGNDETRSNLEVIFVHGCENRASKLAKSLQQTARRIHEQVSPHRLHIWSYDTAKLLQKGLDRYQELWQRLLEALAVITSKAPANTNFAFVTHNTGIWLVQKVLVEWQYWPNNGGYLPVGVIAVCLPGARRRDKWDSRGWAPFCSELLLHLKEDHREATLKFDTIKQAISDFDLLLDDIKSKGEELRFVEAPITENKNVSRASTIISRTSDLSDVSNGHKATGFTRIEPGEADDVVAFLKELCTATPVNIPTTQTMRKRQDSSVSHPGSRAPSRGRKGDILEFRQGRVDSDLAWHADQSGARMEGDSVQCAESQRLPQKELRNEPAKSERTPKTVNFESPRKDTPAPMINRTDHKRQGQYVKKAELKYNKELASDYYACGDFDEAKRRFKYLIDSYSIYQKDKSYYRICLNLAQISFYKGRYQSARKKFEMLYGEMLSLSKEEKVSKLIGEAGRWLALSQWKLGEYGLAEMTVKECCHMFENDPQVSLWSTWALVLAFKGAFKDAWELSMRALSLAEASLAAEDQTVRRLDDPMPNQKDSGQKEPKDSRWSTYRSCLFDHARIATEMGNFDEAARKSKIVLEDLQRRLGPKHIVTLDAASLHAWLLVFENNPIQSGEEVLRTLRKMRETLGEEHPSTLQAVQTLVLMYKSDGRYSDAQETAQYLVGKCEGSNELGSTHPQTLNSKAILADVLLAIGDWDRAKEIQLEILSTEKENFVFRTALANVLWTKGEWDLAQAEAVGVLLEELRLFGSEDEAKKEDEPYQYGSVGEQMERDYLKELLFSCDRIGKLVCTHLSAEGALDPFQGKGPFHIYPLVVRTLHCLALSEQIRDDADLDFVQTLLEKLYDILERQLPPKHRLLFNVQYDIAVNHRLRGDLNQSLRLLDIIVLERLESLGSDHPDYLAARHQHAVTLFRMSKWQKALEEQESTLRTQEFLLGKHHADVVISRYTLSGIYHSLNRFQEADHLLSSVIKDQTRLYGGKLESPRDHPIVLRSRARRALIRLDIRDFDGAEAEQRLVLERREEKFGNDHSLTRNAKNDLAQIKQAAGELRRAEELYMELLGLPETLHGPFVVQPCHTAFDFQVQSNLASCWFELGQEIGSYNKTKQMQEMLYAQMKDAVGRGEPDEQFIAVTFNLALTNKAMGRHPEASIKLNEAYVFAMDLLGTSHPQTQELRSTVHAWALSSSVALESVSWTVCMAKSEH